DLFPGTFESYFDVGKKLKANGRPLGQALSHSFGDPPTWCYPLMWAYGGREVDEAGKVDLDRPETVAAVEAMKDAWQSAFDETGLAWDDTANNRAFLAGTVSAVLNGASIWWVARNDKSPFFEDIGLELLPPGPKGRALFVLNNNYAVMGYSPNAEAAKAFIRWTMQPDVWLPWFKVGGSYYSGVGEKQEDNPIWDEFPPQTRVFKGAGRETRYPGWPGPYSQQAGLAQSKYIIVDMFAKAVQGESPEAAVKWAANELAQIYVA
ncbi:MAG: extracellular solute-binding protein, partial [Chloroflexota bacterium]|nr:extracellular solute-binding protein [Chloroflexota bacterium]